MSVAGIVRPEDIPVGRVPGGDSDRRGSLVLRLEGWSLRRPRRPAARGRWADGPGHLAARLPLLDELHALTVVAPGTHDIPAGVLEGVVAPFVVRAAARGTLVLSDLDLPHAVPAVAGRPGDLAFDLAGVRQRRTVLSDHLLARARPTVTAVVATRRPHLLPHVAETLAQQTYDLEVVVVLHGADPSGVPPLDLRGRPLQVLSAPADRSLGHALALGSAAAGGDLVTKVDDDDHYGPDHVRDLVLAHRYSGATVVGKSTTLVHLEELDVTVRRVFGTPESFVHRVAGGTILLARDDLRALGGWSDVPRAVDSALMRSAHTADARIYRPHDLGYVYVRHGRPPEPGGAVTGGTDQQAGHTWAAGAGHFLVSAREQWLGLLAHPELGTAPATEG